MLQLSDAVWATEDVAGQVEVVLTSDNVLVNVKWSIELETSEILEIIAEEVADGRVWNSEVVLRIENVLRASELLTTSDEERIAPCVLDTVME